MKNAELIARLRLIAGKGMADYFNSGHPNSNAITEAADAIEALEAEVEAVKKSEIERLLRIETKVDELVTERDALQAQLAAAQTEVERLNIYNSHLRGYNSRLQSKQMVVTDVAAIPQQPAQPVLRVIPTAQGVFPVWFDGAWRKSVYKYGTDYGTGIALYAAPIPQQPAEQAPIEADMFWNHDDAEKLYFSIDEFLNDEICNGTPLEVGDTRTIQCALRLPNIEIRITAVHEEKCEADYEVIAAAPQPKDMK